MRCDYHHPRLPRCDYPAEIIIKVDHSFIQHCRFRASLAGFKEAAVLYGYIALCEDHQVGIRGFNWEYASKDEYMVAKIMYT
jgi:hypothetical protein